MNSNPIELNITATKQYITELVQNKIKNKLTEQEMIGINEYINSMSYHETITLLNELGIRDFESKFGSALKLTAATIAGGVIGNKAGLAKSVGLTIGGFTMYYFRKMTDPCQLACVKLETGTERDICKYKCYIKACETIMKDVKSQIAKCDSTRNPSSCEKRLNKNLMSWVQKRENYIEKLNNLEDKYVDDKLQKKRQSNKRMSKLRKKISG